MTTDQERRIGEILGYPACCVEAFVSDPGDKNKALRRGLIVLPNRSPENAARVSEQISELLGRSWKTSGRAQYVPCRSCMGSAGWHSFDIAYPSLVRAAILA